MTFKVNKKDRKMILEFLNDNNIPYHFCDLKMTVICIPENVNINITENITEDEYDRE